MTKWRMHSTEPQAEGFSEYRHRNDVNINTDAVANAYNPTHLEGWDMIARLRPRYWDPVPNNLKVAKKNLFGLVKKQKQKLPVVQIAVNWLLLSKPRLEGRAYESPLRDMFQD